MLLDRISRLLFIVVLVICLGRKVCLEESFKLFRGEHDIFSNSKCLQPAGGLNCRDSCGELAAMCKDVDCSYCICDNNENTYFKNSSGRGKCVKDEEIASCSGRYTFAQEKVLLFLSPEDCGSCSSNYENRLEPISFKLKRNMCELNWLDSEYQRQGDTWKPVNVKNTFFFLEKIIRNDKKKNFLRISGSAFKTWNGSLIKLNFNCHRVTKKNKSKSQKGCVLLKFETLPKYSQVSTTSKPTTNQTSSPADHQQNVVSTVIPYLELTSPALKTATISSPLATPPSKSVSSSRSTRSIKPTAVNTMVTEFPNGNKETKTLTSSPTLTTLSSNSDPNTIQATKEHLSHTTKTTTMPKSFPSNTVTSFLPSTTISHPNTIQVTKEHLSHTTKTTTMPKSFPSNTVTSFPPSTTISDPNTIQATKEHLSHTTKTTTMPKSFPSNTVISFPPSTTISPKSDRSNGSTLILKAITISLSVVLFVVILCLAVAFFVFCKRKKRNEAKQKREDEEMQLYEDPSQMYQPLTENRRGTGDEHPYQELVRLGSQGRDTSLNVQTNPTNLGVQDEYSTASTENLSRSFSPSQPLPSRPVVCQTLEDSDTSDNTTPENAKLSDNKEHDSENEPLGEECKLSPLYQTLEDQEIAQSPELKLDDESTGKSMDSAAEESLGEECKSPVYQTLDDQEITQNQELKLDDESTGKSMDSAAEESLGEECKSPVYQTLDDQEIAQNPELKLDDESTNKNLDSVTRESLDQQSPNPVCQTLGGQTTVQKRKSNDELDNKSLDSAGEKSIDQQSQSSFNQTLETSAAGQDTTSEMPGKTSVVEKPPDADPVYDILDSP